MAFFLSLTVYALLCLTIARLFIRTGHSMLWVAVAFLPFGLILLSYGLASFDYLPQLSRGILTFVVLIYLAILAVLSLKSWPSDRNRHVESPK
jgi:hypothetical protein